MAIPTLYFMLECTACGARQVVHDTYLTHVGTSTPHLRPGDGYGGPPLPERYRCPRRCRAPQRVIGSIWRPGDREMWMHAPRRPVELTDVQVGEWSRLIHAPARHARAWLMLDAALAIHVVDEALTGFLDFYNPLVLTLRSQFGWWPMPTFAFGPWLAGLIALVIALALLTPVIRRGARGTGALSWFLSAVMLLNGIGHLAGSIYFQRWLPGATSAPLLIVASVLLARAVWERQRRNSVVSFTPEQTPEPPDSSFEFSAEHARGPLITIRFRGRYPPGSEGNDFAGEMTKYAKRIIYGTRAAGVVFDLREMDYTWGDALAGLGFTLQDGVRFRPAAIVATGPTATAIEGLLRPNMLLGVAGVKLFASLENAMAHVTAALDHLDQTSPSA